MRCTECDTNLTGGSDHCEPCRNAMERFPKWESKYCKCHPASREYPNGICEICEKDRYIREESEEEKEERINNGQFGVGA